MDLIYNRDVQGLMPKTNPKRFRQNCSHCKTFKSQQLYKVPHQASLGKAYISSFTNYHYVQIRSPSHLCKLPFCVLVSLSCLLYFSREWNNLYHKVLHTKKTCRQMQCITNIYEIKTNEHILCRYKQDKYCANFTRGYNFIHCYSVISFSFYTEG